MLPSAQPSSHSLHICSPSSGTATLGFPALADGVERLTLRLRDWGDGTAELRAEVKAGEFCGVGSANFNRTDLRERARAFSKYPLASDAAVEIAGGYWSKADPAVLLQELLYIGVSSTTARGVVAMKIRLSVPKDDANNAEAQASVSVELTLGYQQLVTFSENLLALVGGNTQEVVLEAGHT